MKAKVLIPFTDKETGKKYEKDAVIDMTVKRFNEVVRKGYIEAAEEEAAATTKTAKKEI